VLGVITGLPRRRQKYTSVRLTHATAYIHDDYVDYRFIGPDAEDRAARFAVEHGASVVPYKDKPSVVVRIHGALLN
jgi:hypothetical protein